MGIIPKLAEKQLNSIGLTKENVILLGLSGSRSYGTNTEKSDTDYKGILIPPRKYYMSPFRYFEQTQWKGDWTTGRLSEIIEASEADEEGTIFGIKKFIKLASECNPNVVETLFINEEYLVVLTEEGRELINNRNLFLSQRAVKTFTGYAISQLNRIRTHKKYLENPPTKRPERKDYLLPEERLLPAHQMMAAHSYITNNTNVLAPWLLETDNQHKAEFWNGIDRIITTVLNESGLSYDEKHNSWIEVEGFVKDKIAGSLGFDSNFIEYLQREKRYSQDKQYYEQYEGWKKNRNAARAELESACGYDCFSDDTEFLTDNGWKRFDEVGDNLLATVYIDEDMTEHKFGCIEYQKPYEKFDGTYNGNMYRFYGHHTDVLVTANHRMLSRHVEKNNNKHYNWKLTEAANITNCFDFLRVITPRVKSYSNYGLFSNLQIPDTTYMRLMGWFLSDGTFNFRKNKDKNKVKSIRISQKKGGKLSSSMARFKNKWGAVTRASIYEYRRKPNKLNSNSIIERILDIRDKNLSERLYKDCGHSKDKRIPRWVFGLSKRLMEALFDGLVMGDGTIRNTSLKSLIYYTSLKGLASDVQELALHCGWETSLYGPYNYSDNNCYMYHVYVNKNVKNYRRLTRTSNLEKLPVNNQRVVCFSVPNGTLVTRRNGEVSIHGNCKHAMHLVRLLKMGEEVLVNGEMNVYRPDRKELLGIRNGDWPYEKLIEWADEKVDYLYNIVRSGKSAVPKDPDQHAIEELTIKLQDMMWERV
jgi:predicted nucleotidyltransferase